MILDILILSIFCNGINLIMSDDMILFPVKQWVDRQLPVLECCYHSRFRKLLIKIGRFVYKPVFGCVICMASVWGTVGYMILRQGFSLDYPLIIVCVAFMNIVLYSLLERIER